MENGINSSHTEKKTLTVLYIVTVTVCCIAGLLTRSFGLFADGALSLLFLSDILKGERKRFVPSIIISAVGVVLGAYTAVIGFFNLSAIIGYADNAASIYVFPLFAVVILLKAALIAFSEAGSHDRADAIFSMVVTVLVIAGTVVTFLGLHYFEPAVAAAIGVYSVYRGIKSIFDPTEHVHAKPEDDTSEEESV